MKNSYNIVEASGKLMGISSKKLQFNSPSYQGNEADAYDGIQSQTPPYIPPGNDYGMPYQYAGPEQNSYNNELLKAQLSVEKEYEINKIRADREVAVSESKSIIREREREIRKAQYDEVFVLPDGTICAETKATRINPYRRNITNIANPKLIMFRHIGHPGDICYCFMCMVNGDKKTIFLTDRQCGSDAYLLKKLSSIGGQMLADKVSRQKDYARKLWNLMVANCTDEYWIPDRKEWYVDENGEINFFRGNAHGKK